MVLSYRSQVLSVERIEPKQLHVLWYDTEQSEESTQDILRNRIIPMTGMAENQFPMDIFDIFNVRAEGYDQRLPMLEAAVRHYHPDLVILDGIRDLVADINDGVVAQDTVERLMRLASTNRCCIVCVLHQNKSVEDRNLRGWIGTELKNKAFEVYECTKSAERIFSWAQTDTRKYDIADKLQFSVNDEGLPYECTPEQLLQAQYKSQLKLADKLQQEGRGAQKLPDFNPKYVHKEGRKHVFDVALLFPDVMKPGVEYDMPTLERDLYAVAGIIKPKICQEVVNKAVQEKVILESRSALNGKKVYLLPITANEQYLPF